MLHVSTLPKAIIRHVNTKFYKGRYNKIKSKGLVAYNNGFCIAPKYKT